MWDLLLKTTEASVTLKVSESPLQAIRVQEQGSYIACGAKDGSVTLIELGPTLSKLQPNEKPMTNAVCLCLCLCLCLRVDVSVLCAGWVVFVDDCVALV